MRSILFFDLPTITTNDKRNYRKFLKSIKKIGFYMIQESVYVKLSIDQQNVDSCIAYIKKITPPKGSIIVLSLTEKQFSHMEIILGDIKTNVINSDERTIIL